MLRDILKVSPQSSPVLYGEDHAFHETKDRRGFTFVELVLAISVIGILSAVALPVYVSQKQTALFNSAAQVIMTIRGDLASQYQLSISRGYVSCPASLCPADLGTSIQAGKHGMRFENAMSATGGIDDPNWETAAGSADQTWTNGKYNCVYNYTVGGANPPSFAFNAARSNGTCPQ